MLLVALGSRESGLQLCCWSQPLMGMPNPAQKGGLILRRLNAKIRYLNNSIVIYSNPPIVPFLRPVTGEGYGACMSGFNHQRTRTVPTPHPGFGLSRDTDNDQEIIATIGTINHA